MSFLSMQFLRIYKRHEFITLHANSKWKVDACIFFLICDIIIIIFPKNTKKNDFFFINATFQDLQKGLNFKCCMWTACDARSI